MCKNAITKPVIYAICGYKNSGKTTLITKLIPLLNEKGYKVATIKHDGHDFVGDVPDTDSYKHKKAGAYGTAVFSNYRFQIVKETQGITELDLMKFFPEADIILIEGMKNSKYPKYICDYPNIIPDELAVLEDILSQSKSKTSDVFSDSVPSAL